MRFFVLISILFLSSTLIAGEGNSSHEEKFLANSRQLIYEGNRSGEGYFSEEGRYLIFQAEREEENPFYQIYMLDFETGDIHRVSPGTGKTTCAYFQWGGDRVLYSSTHRDPEALEKQQEELDFRASGEKRRYAWDYDPTMDIFTSLHDGSDIKQLTNAYGYDAEGSFSPDGKRIVFSSNRRAYPGNLSEKEKSILEVNPSHFCDLYMMNSDGSDLQQLTDVPGYDGGPFFSADGEKIVWRRFETDGHTADIYIMNADGSGEKRITDFGCMSWAPFFHPSGDYILFAANKMGYSNFELYMVDEAGMREPVRVTYTDKFDGLPVFSPDGSELVWTSGRTADGSAQLFIAGWNDSYAREQLEQASLRESVSDTIVYGFSEEILASELERKLAFVASDDAGGRMTGSEGIRMVADYISGIYRNLGLEPLGDKPDYFWPFDFVSDVKLEAGANLFELEGRELEIEKDYVPMSSTQNDEVKGEVVFAGYGLKVTDGKDYTYDSYESLEVDGKIVMVFSGIPDSLDPEKKKLFERNIETGYRQMLARQNGADAVLIVTSGISPAISHEVAGSAGIVSMKISEDVAEEILAGKNETVGALKEKLSDGDPAGNEHLFSTGAEVRIRASVDRIVSQDNNIVGVIKAEDPGAEYIMIGAHYDHLGFGETSSRSVGEDRKKVHNGADDNGSGTVTVIELAEYFSGLKRSDPGAIRNHLVFCLWSGEELGLLGSSAFVSDMDIPAEKVTGYINFDMVGRVTDNKLDVQGIGSAEEWKAIVERKNVVSGFDLTMVEDPYLPTDATSFYVNGIPVISLFSGVHNDYHTHKDDVEFINFEDLQRVVKLASHIVSEMMKPDQSLTYNKVQVRQRTSNRGAFNVSLGTIPAYAGSDEPGVVIQGVRPDGPADKAGLQAEDNIIGLNGMEVNNIYDFMNILKQLKPDVETQIVVRREGEQMTLPIVPEARKK